MSSPTRSPSPSPPSPVPFIPPAPRSPTWDEYLASSSSGSGGPYEFSFPDGFGGPIAANLPEPPRETRHGLTYPPTSSGPSPSYYATQRRPPMKMTPMNQKRKASALPPPASFPMMATPPPVVVTFPLSVTRAGMKTAIDLKAAAVTPRDDGSNATQVGRWTKREHELFLEGLQRFGKSWKKISSLVHTRTLVQIRTHAQKYLQKQSRAAITADAKAAEEAAALQSQQPSKSQQQQQQQQRPFRQDERCLPQQQPRVAAGAGTGRQPTLQVDVPRVPTPPARQWKSPPAGDRNNTFVPLAFPSTLSTSAPASRSAFQTNSVSRLDQLLQDDSSTVPVFVDEYYTSPTAIEDDLLRPLYTGEQWVPRLAHPAASANYSNKRRRVDTSGPPCSSAAVSTTVAVPALRPAFPGTTFEPLPAPDNLSSPSTSPSAYTPRQSAAAAVLLAAHETDERPIIPTRGCRYDAIPLVPRPRGSRAFL